MGSVGLHVVIGTALGRKCLKGHIIIGDTADVLTTYMAVGIN